MIKKIIYSILCLVFLAYSSGCKKDKITYEVTPEITFVSISPGSVNAYSDEVVIRIAYTDGDGDLGENVSGVENAFITDTRSNLTYGLRIRQLGPDNEELIIKGEIDLIIPGLGISGTSTETATFSVYIKDRAGNQSNVITTSAISVTP
jgi:hypothetical protein